VGVPVESSMSVEEGYDRWARSYDRDPNPLLALEERQLFPLLPDLNGKAVLDVACGTGRWLERLLNRGPRSGLGVDLSSAMLDAARVKRGLRGRLVRADAVHLPFASASADFTLCSFALAHFADLDPLAREVARLARPQSDLMVTDVHPAGYARGWQTAFRADRATTRIATFLHTVGEVRAAFESAGFELRQLIEAHLGEPERPIFVRAGKGHRFEEACSMPAVLICCFRRKASEGKRTT
jgi:malonyl-CoA O-methyltransferase